MTGINNQGDDGTDNRLVVDYSVIFSNVLNNVVASSNYYISSGVVISDYYNEVGLLFLTTNRQDRISNIFSRLQILSPFPKKKVECFPDEATTTTRSAMFTNSSSHDRIVAASTLQSGPAKAETHIDITT